MCDDNTIQYHLPESSEITFAISPSEKELFVKLLRGFAQLYIADVPFKHPIGRELPLPNFQCMTPVLKTEDGCDFWFRGRHHVFRATSAKTEVRYNFMGHCTDRYSYIFTLERSAQLQIFVSEFATDSDVSLEFIRGKPEVLGITFPFRKRYFLPRCSSLVVASSNQESCTVGIYGKKRRIKVSMCGSERTWIALRSVHDRIKKLRLEAIERKSAGPTILVIGPEHVGKTTFCRYLLNKALEDEMKPIFIDLDVKRNSNTIPGAMSLTVTKDKHFGFARLSSDCQSLLWLGSYELNGSNVQHYYLLMRRMGELLRNKQKADDTKHAGAIIDMLGSYAMFKSSITRILESFTVDLIVFVGEKDNYEGSKRCSFKGVESVFVPRPLNIEPRKDELEQKIRENIIENYFCDLKKEEPHSFRARFSDFHVYRIRANSPYHLPSKATLDDLSVLPVTWDPSIELYLLGVTDATDVDVDLSMAEIKYFVFFTFIDMENQMVTVNSPTDHNCKGKILVKGDFRIH